MAVPLYRETISHIAEVKYIPLSFWNVHPNYQGPGSLRIGLEHTISQIGFFPKHTSSDSSSGKVIIISPENMKMEIGFITPVLPLSYVKYGGIVTNGCIYGLWQRT